MTQNVSTGARRNAPKPSLRWVVPAEAANDGDTVLSVTGQGVELLDMEARWREERRRLVQQITVITKERDALADRLAISMSACASRDALLFLVSAFLRDALGKQDACELPELLTAVTSRIVTADRERDRACAELDELRGMSEPSRGGVPEISVDGLANARQTEVDDARQRAHELNRCEGDRSADTHRGCPRRDPARKGGFP